MRAGGAPSDSRQERRRISSGSRLRSDPDDGQVPVAADLVAPGPIGCHHPNVLRHRLRTYRYGICPPGAASPRPAAAGQGQEPATTLMVKVRRAVAPVSSFTWTVKENVPDRDGVPVTRASGRFSKVLPEKRVPSGTSPETSLNSKVDGPVGSLETM